MQAFQGRAGMQPVSGLTQDQGFLSWLADKINTTVQGAVQWVLDNPDTALRLWRFFTNVPGLPVPPAPPIFQPEPEPPEQFLGFAPTRGRTRGITRLQPVREPEFQPPGMFPEPPPPTRPRPSPIAPTPIPVPVTPQPRRRPRVPEQPTPTPRPTPENGPRRPELPRDRVVRGRGRVPGTRANGPPPDNGGRQPRTREAVAPRRGPDRSQPEFIPGARRPRETRFRRSGLTRR